MLILLAVALQMRPNGGLLGRPVGLKILLVGCAFVKAAKPSERIYGATDHDGLPLFI